MKGLVVRSLGGFYDVLCGGEKYDCRPRGIFRKDKTVILVGDRVEMEVLEEGKGVITALFDRKNTFTRPPVSNIDKMLIVLSAKDPDPDTLFADKMTVICSKKDVEPVIVINKSDLCDVSSLADTYTDAGFRVFRVSAAGNEGIDSLASYMKGSICAIAGFSGVGKSSIISILVDRALETGEISPKLGRGRHTTRHVEIFPAGTDTYIADTPGFSSLDILSTGIDAEDLCLYFPEFEKYLAKCRYTTCSHTKEDGCSIRDAVSGGEIPLSRHESYVQLYAALKEIPSWKRQDNN